MAEVSALTGMPRATVHRLTLALEEHGFLGRREGSGLSVGPFPLELASESATETMVSCAPPFLANLRDACGETAQIFRVHGQNRLCVAAAERPSGLRDSVRAGDILPMTAGSGAQVLLAWDVGTGRRIPEHAKFTAGDLASVRARGWAQSVGEREIGLSSVSAPVWYRGRVIGAICVAGPTERVGSDPGQRLAAHVVAAAADLASRVAAVLGAG